MLKSIVSFTNLIFFVANTTNKVNYCNISYLMKILYFVHLYVYAMD